MILLIDNYDSFVYSLARYVGTLGRARHVVRNDSITAGAVAALSPEAIILSPGPCTPAESGACMDIIRAFYKTIPILGVCLGHQCIGEAFGGRTVRAPRPVHGRASPVEHEGTGLFMGIPSPFSAARYHSLVTELPANTDLRVTARTQDGGTVMAMNHVCYPIYGLQFHPESVLTEHGPDIMRNFLVLADAWNEDREEAA